MRRQPKIEDTEGDVEDFAESKTSLSQAVMASRQQSRAQSIRSQASMSNLPYGARRHRASWSSRDLPQDLTNEERVYPVVHARISDADMRDSAVRSRAQSMMDRAPSRNVPSPLPSRVNTPDVLGEKQRGRRRSISSTGFGNINEGHGDGREEKTPLPKEVHV